MAIHIGNFQTESDFAEHISTFTRPFVVLTKDDMVVHYYPKVTANE